MRTAVMKARNAEVSPRTKARITGAFFLLTMVAGIFAQGFVSERLIVFSNAAATASNILAHKTLFQWGFTVYMIEMAAQIVTTVLLYDLLKPVSNILSLLAAFLGLAGCIIKVFARVFYIAPLFVLGGAHYSTGFSPEQLRALALLLLEVNNRGAGMALAFFGFSTLLQGYLIFRSTFLPRILGFLSALAGLCWLSFLSPSLGYRIFPYVAAYGLLVALALIAWLLVFGLNEQRWKEQAGAA